jgi:hypothetical protein
MRILGVTASGFNIVGDYELISTTILPSNAPSVTFDVSSFAFTYKHLQIRMTARLSASTGITQSLLRFNGDIGSNYATHRLGGYGSTIESAANTSQTSIFVGSIPTAGITANAFAGSIIDILDPFSTTKNKTVRSLQGVAASGNAIELRSGFRISTESTTSISLTSFSDSYVAGSRFSLYGIRG